jgi:uroporphyrin-III C-methyltransferase
MGKVIFVGAGPGDCDLITIKGAKTLVRANVVLYDALLSTELLEYCSDDCKLIYVGKRKSKKELTQDEINRLLVFYAERYGYVVRLKGGDPHVFGRGHEEATFVQAHGFETETIPGVTSAIAAPAAAGIPLTKRGVNESFWVITGTLSNDTLSNDIRLAAQSTATIVVLMGVSHLEKIASLISGLRSPHEPIAIIQNATSKDEKVVCGTARTISELARIEGITSPAVIVIGNVVAERKGIQKIIRESTVNV